MKPTVYIETTIVSYLTAWPSRDVVRLSHQVITRRWWDTAHDRFTLYTSDLVIAEASAGDAAAASERMNALAGIPLLRTTDQVQRLASDLAVAMSLPSRAQADAAHVAIAAMNGVQFLLTWNCTHLANAALADRIDEVCSDAGVTAPRIVTPELLQEAP